MAAIFVLLCGTVTSGTVQNSELLELVECTLGMLLLHGL